MVYDQILITNINNIIKEKGVKKKAVAEKVNISAQKFSDMLNGRRYIISTYIIPIANALGVEPNDLFATDRPDKSA